MFLKAVQVSSSEDDEEEVTREDASLYGRSSADACEVPSPDSSPAASAARKVGTAAPKRKKVRKVAEVVLPTGGASIFIRTLGLCCCLGVFGVGVLLALLRRFGDEASKFSYSNGPVPVFFSFASSTDAALAWLASALLAGRPPNTTIGDTFFALQGQDVGRFLPDGKLMGIWHPQVGSPMQNGLAHGRVSSMLRRVHGLGPPRVLDLSQVGRGRLAQIAMPMVPEADAFLALRALFADAAEQEESSGQRRLSRKLQTQLILISHPHHVPYLAALAQASGFRPLGLDPALYSQVPWSDFGCDRLGYETGTSPQELLQRELSRLGSFAESLSGSDADNAAALQRLLIAANSTLHFNVCVTDLAAGGTGGANSTASCASSLPTRR